MDGGLAADGLPAGTVELRRRPAGEYAGEAQWPVHGTAVVAPGGRARLQYRER